MRLVSAKIEMVKIRKAIAAGNQKSAFSAVIPKPFVSQIGLVLDDFREVEIAEVKEDRDHRKTEGDFVGNHLRGGADAADEGEFRIRGPAGDRDAVNAERGNRENEKRTDVDVRDDEFVLLSIDDERGAERNHADGDEGGNDGQGGREPVEGFPDVIGSEVFLEEQLDAVSNRLDEAEQVEVLFRA
jgi:hypothetical protein